MAAVSYVSTEANTKATAGALPHVTSIHYLRGIAALGVALSHAGHYVSKTYGVSWPNDIFSGWFAIYGVAIFFAISGYLMAELIQRQPPATFLFRRILRIYPPFLIAVLLTLSLSPVSFFGTSWTHIFLIPAGPDRSALLVEWTLVHEMFFYFVVFAIAAIGLKEYIPIVAVVWSFAIVVSALSGVHRPTIGLATISDLPLMYANTGFSAGLLVPTILKHFRNSAILFLVFCLTFLFTYYHPSEFNRMWAGLGSAGLIAAAVLHTPKIPNIINVFLSKWGDWSYGLYLIHVPIIRSLLFYLYPSFAPEITFPLIVAGTIIGGALMGMLDLNIHSGLRRVSQRIPSWMVSYFIAALVVGYVIACAYNYA
ncbi:acyltransferase [Ochrobactrum sp. MC-1LL]|uniref:acyltransferase family protein n=1 Tax=Ochrobactrum sp. MC-1LL TaxID=2735351 RepID=UPI0014385330|nr:acyltransferase [Ochrobactrum sp. MC-1LL]NKE77529.1 acyltransferase [Ochrobactrum sp. MC-1LL]